MDYRAARLLLGLECGSRVIEVGPSYQPLAPKAGGWRTTVVDHADRRELIAKYRNEPVDTGRIEEVDVIWTGGLLHEAFPAASRGTYSALIASHVLEHVPDPIGFLKSAEALVDPSVGTVRLALPDRRLCFDVFRPASTTGRVLAANRAGSTRHGYADHFDHVAYLARVKGQAGWGTGPLAGLALDHTLEVAMSHAARATAPDAGYIDCHGWQFTPASFELLVLELSALGVIDWRIDWIEPQPYIEFFACLSRPALDIASVEDLQHRRCTLLKRMLVELRDVADRLIGS